MSLATGTRIGPYEIVTPIGAGGMGEVYRARDTKLNRDVAIKVLLPAVANDPDRLARFSREAQVLASLNHPNIAAIYGIEDAAIVMELVEGEDLAQRIARGPIPLDEALVMARQIAEALEAAHDHGIIHRDLKPANIKVRSDGTVKVLDFGLAKAIETGSGIRGPGSADAMNSPTLSIHATEAGLILGTAAYMSPEQAAGKTVDKRSDLWAFGVVLLEMLTGRPVFKGETVSHLIAAVLKDEPDWSALPADTPASIRRLLRRCLEKDRKRRLPDAADVRLEIDDASTPATSTVPNARPWFALASFVVGGVVIGAVVWAVARGSNETPPAAAVRFAIHDTDEVIVSRVPGDVALSPDGRMLAFVGFGEGGPRIWVRDLQALGSRAVPGTEAAVGVGWSPDGRSLVFNAHSDIRKVALSGGSPEAVSSGGLNAVGAQSVTFAWGPDGTIFSSDARGLWRAADTGTPATVVVPNSDAPQDATDFLPDGRHYLLSVRSSDPAKAGTFVAAVDGSARTRILPFPSWARYAMGHLLFVRDRVLYAQPFDASSWKLSGAPAALAESAAGLFTASQAGTVAYLPLDASERPDSTRLSWFDRTGRVIGSIDQAAGAIAPVLSPDGRRLAMYLRGDIWILEIARGVMSKVTTGGGNFATWLPDSARMIFFRGGFRQSGKDVIFQMLPGSEEKETVVVEPADRDGPHAHPNDVSADGRHLTYEGGGARDIWVKSLTGDGAARAVVAGPSLETQPMFSPDGRWLTYTSNASGRFEVYVQRFPEGGARIQVSPAGGASARWRRDGKELFYLALDGTLMAVPVVHRPSSIEFGSPAALFKFFSSQRGNPSQRPQFDVAADGQRFIVSSIPRRNDPSIQVLLNWPALLKKD